MDPKDLDSIIEAIKKADRASFTKALSEALAKANRGSQVSDFNKQVKQSITNLQKDAQKQKELNAILDQQVDAYEKLLKSQSNLAKGFESIFLRMGVGEQRAKLYSENATMVSTALTRFGKAATDGSGRINDYTAAFKDFGLVGFAVNDLGQRLQQNVDVFRTLSNVGAAFGQNLVTLRETAAAAGLPLQDFVGLIAQNSEKLAALFGSTTQGAVEFSRLSKRFRDTNLQVLAPLGFTVSDINDVLLTNLELQRRTGTFIEGADQQQIDSARTLAIELDRLAKLTGQQRTELLRTMESQMSNERLLAFLGSQTDETRQRLQAFSASVGTLAPGLAEGFQDLIANAGVPVTAASRSLIQNIPEATTIIQQLTDGTLSSSQAMVQLRDAAQRSNDSLRGVAQTGTVEFARLFGEVNKLAKAKLDETAVTEEQLAKQNKLTAAVTEFESVSKELSASFQSIETGFFATLGNVIGDGTSGINKGLTGLAGFIKDLNPVTKALLFTTKTIGSYFIDKAGQVLTTGLGTALGIRMSGGLGGGLGGMGGKLGGAARVAGGVGLGITGVGIGSAMAASSESNSGKLLGVGTSAAGGALTGAAIGSIIPGVGTVIGGTLGAILGAAAGMGSLQTPEKRATGTMGEIGLPFEPRNTMARLEAGERVLNPTEAKEYAGGNEELLSQYSQLNRQMTQYNMTAKEMLQLQKENNRAVSTLVAVNMATEKNTKKTSKMVDKVGPSLV
jgi:hypothetical protein